MSSLIEYIDEWELFTLQEKAYVSNGCGPKMYSLADWVPDFCDLYEPACAVHDWIYWSGGSGEIRNLADNKLRVDMQEINNTLRWWKRWSMLWAPRVYYWAVSYFGKSSYHSADKRRTRLDLQREMKDADI